MPPLLGMHLVFDYPGFLPRYDATAPRFVALSIVQRVIMATMVAVTP